MSLSSAEQHFLAYRTHGRARDLGVVFDQLAPHLLLVAQRVVRDPALAEDVVQIAFAELLQGRAKFEPGRALLPWMSTVVSNQAHKVLRSERRRISGARYAPEHDVPAPDREAEDGEIREYVLRALEELPEAYRDVLTLRYLHGFTVARTAETLGRSVATVKTQQRRAVEKLRNALPGSLAGAFAIAALGTRGPAALRQRVLDEAAPEAMVADPVGPTTRTWSAKLAIAAMALISAAVAVSLSWPSDPGRLEQAEVEAARPRPEDVAPVPAASVGAREPIVASDRDVTSRLVVRWSDGTAAAGVWVGRQPVEDRSAWRREWARTDDRGSLEWTARLDGSHRLIGDRGGEVVVASGSAGELVIPHGVDVTCLVTDAAGEPVADATVWLGRDPARADTGVRVVDTGSDGRVVLRDVSPGTALSAFAPGFVGARMVILNGEVDETELVLDLGAQGGTLSGTVRDRDDRPIRGAEVMVGWMLHRISGATGVHERNAVPPPLTTRTDAQGRFAVHGVRLFAEQPIWARAAGYAVGVEMIAVRPDHDRTVDLVLEPEGRVHGALLDAEGRPVAGAVVRAADSRFPPTRFDMGPSWAVAEVQTGEDGEFELGGVAPGFTWMHARADGRAVSGRVTVSSDVPARWRATLGGPDRIRGHLRPPVGVSLEGWRVEAQPAAGGPPITADVDAHGRFELRGCATMAHDLRLLDPDAPLPRPVLERRGVRPGDAWDEAVSADRVPSSWIEGRVTDPDGRPATNVALLVDTRGYKAQVPVPASGEFRLGPLPAGPVRVVAFAGGRGLLPIGTFDMAAGETRQVGAVAFAPASPVEIVLVDPDGEPARTPRCLTASVDLPHPMATRLQSGVGKTHMQPGRYYFRCWTSRSFGYGEFEVQVAQPTRFVVQRQEAEYRRVLFVGSEVAVLDLDVILRGADGAILARKACHWTPDHPLAIDALGFPRGRSVVEIRAPGREPAFTEVDLDQVRSWEVVRLRLP